MGVGVLELVSLVYKHSIKLFECFYISSCLVSWKNSQNFSVLQVCLLCLLTQEFIQSEKNDMRMIVLLLYKQSYIKTVEGKR